MITTFGIVGHRGMVGGVLFHWLEKIQRSVIGYDLRDITDTRTEIAQCECIFICTPTPFRNNTTDLSSIENSLNWINHLAKPETIVVIKSTIPPGTTQRLQNQYPQLLLMINPEFLTEATADNDMEYPDRQILGITNQSKCRAKEVLLNLPLAPYEAIVNSTEAEIIKYFGNNWFVLKVLMANYYFDLCQKFEIDYEIVKEALAADKRIERTHLTPIHKGGRGASGGCLPKDLASAITFFQEAGFSVPLFEIARQENDRLCIKSQKTETKGMYEFRND